MPTVEQIDPCKAAEGCARESDRDAEVSRANGDGSSASSPSLRTARHSWLKLRLHVYMCIRCGAGYENIQDRTGGWYRRWFLPDRSTVNTLRVPDCAPGPTTAKRILHYSAQLLALADGKPHKLKMLRASIDCARGGSANA